MLGKGIAMPQDIELISTDTIAMFFDDNLHDSGDSDSADSDD